MVRVLLICGSLYSIQQAHEIFISDGELLQEPILLEDAETKMGQSIIVQGLIVSKHIELPLLKIFSCFQNEIPLPATSQIQHLHDSLFIFL